MSKFEIQAIRNEVFSATSTLMSITARLDALKAQPEPVTPVKPGRWKPEIGDWYWWNAASGRNNRAQWANDKNDQNFWSRGDVYPTEAAAKYADDRAVALQAMHDWADARFTPDWKDDSQTKLTLNYYHKDAGWCVSSRSSTQENDWPVFATEADFNEFLAVFRDRMHFLLERTKP